MSQTQRGVWHKFQVSEELWRNVTIPVPTRQSATEGNFDQENMNSKRKPRGGASRSVETLIEVIKIVKSIIV